MVLYLVGLGLGDERDVTMRGYQAVQDSSLVFLESYTSILAGDNIVERLQSFYKKDEIIVADRHLVESEATRIYEPALSSNVALLVVGDPVCATTHTDIMLRAREYGVKVELIHNASVMGAAGVCGLQLYNFGQTVSIPFWRSDSTTGTAWQPTSFCPKIQYNSGGYMHTLCLLDIKVKEPDFAALIKGRQNVFLPPRYMTVNTACEQLTESFRLLGGIDKVGYDPATTLCVGLARLGQPTQQIVAGTMEELQRVDFGPPLHSLIVCGELHELELECLKEYLVEESKYQLVTRPEEVVPEETEQDDE